MLLEKEMATHLGVLAWRIPWMEEPGGLQSMESTRVGHNWETNTNTHKDCYRKIKLPVIMWITPYHCREEKKIMEDLTISTWGWRWNFAAIITHRLQSTANVSEEKAKGTGNCSEKKPSHSSGDRPKWTPLFWETCGDTSHAYLSGHIIHVIVSIHFHHVNIMYQIDPKRGFLLFSLESMEPGLE